MPSSIAKIEKEIAAIKERNARVERDKAWEISGTRKVVIFVLTYMVVSLLLLVAGIPDPFINALVPSIAFVLSTATLSFAKGWWLGKYNG